MSIVKSLPVSVLAFPALSVTTILPSVTSPAPAVIVICVLLFTTHVMPAGVDPPTVIFKSVPSFVPSTCVKNPLPVITEVAPFLIVSVATDDTEGLVLSTVSFLLVVETLPAGSVTTIAPSFMSPDPPVMVICVPESTV